MLDRVGIYINTLEDRVARTNANRLIDFEFFYRVIYAENEFTAALEFIKNGSP